MQTVSIRAQEQLEYDIKLNTYSLKLSALTAINRNEVKVKQNTNEQATQIFDYNTCTIQILVQT